MLIISEVKLEDSRLDFYRKNNIRFAYGYEKNVYPHKGESVGFILDTLYASTIDRIGYYLATKHKVTLKYEGVTYKLDTIYEWKHTYQDPKDQLRTKTDLHPVLREYYSKRDAYIEAKQAHTKTLEYEQVYLDYPELKFKTDEELASFIRELAPMYEVDTDYTDRLDLLRSYIQLHFYLDNDIEYSRPANDVQIVSVGDPVLFEDLVYKAKKNPEHIDNMLQSMIQLD